MSVVDLVFNHGPRSREILLSGNPTRDDYLMEAKALINERSRILHGRGV
jgi:hypothetical protein